MLINGLPQESATHTALRDAAPARVVAEKVTASAGHGRWSHEATILAAIYDQLGALRYEQQALAGVKSPTKPRPMPRPGVGEAAKVRPISAEARDYLSRLRAARGA